MAAANQPKGSVSTGSIKPVTRKAVRCQREVAWLVTQAAGKLVATTDDVNAPTPSFVLVRQQHCRDRRRGTRLAGSFKGTRRCFLHKLSVYVFPDRAADDSGQDP